MFNCIQVTGFIDGRVICSCVLFTGVAKGILLATEITLIIYKQETIPGDSIEYLSIPKFQE